MGADIQRKQRNTQKIKREEKGWGGRAKTEYRLYDAYASCMLPIMILCAKTSNLEIANTDCVRTRNYPKEVKVSGHGNRGGHGGSFEGAGVARFRDFVVIVAPGHGICADNTLTIRKKKWCGVQNPHCACLWV
jgi:hypothetical protein